MLKGWIWEKPNLYGQIDLESSVQSDGFPYCSNLQSFKKIVIFKTELKYVLLSKSIHLESGLFPLPWNILGAILPIEQKTEIW